MPETVVAAGAVQPRRAWTDAVDQAMQTNLGDNPPPLTDIFTHTKQSSQGNCASMAMIKEAMRTYGPQVFQDVERTGDGYQVQMRDGFKLQLSLDQLEHSAATAAFKGLSNPEGALALFAFAALARRQQMTGRHDSKTFETAIDDLCTAQSAKELAGLLGLTTYAVGPQTGHFVAQSSNHAIFIDGTQADHYGKAVQYDGTDTNGKLLTGEFGFTLDPTPYPSQQYRVTPNPRFAVDVPSGAYDRILEHRDVTDVALGPQGEYVVINGTNGYLYDKAPAALGEKIKALNDANSTINTVAIGPDGGWAVVFDNSGYQWQGQGGPETLGAKLKELNGQSASIQTVSLGPNESWALAFNRSGWSTMNAPESLNDALGKLNSDNNDIQCIALSPSGGWVVIYDHCGYWAQGVPPELLDRLKLLNQSRCPIKAVEFGPNGEWAVGQGSPPG